MHVGCFPCVPINVRYAGESIPYGSCISPTRGNWHQKSDTISWNLRHRVTVSCTKAKITIVTVTYTRRFFRKFLVKSQLTRSSKHRFLFGHTTFSSRYNERRASFPCLKSFEKNVVKRGTRHASCTDEGG